MVFAGTVAMEAMGFKMFGFACGRADEWEPEQVNWGSEGQWLATSATAAIASWRILSAPCRWA